MERIPESAEKFGRPGGLGFMCYDHRVLILLLHRSERPRLVSVPKDDEMLGRIRRLLKGEAPPPESGASVPPSESDADVPPAQLRKRVHGSEDLEGFEQV